MDRAPDEYMFTFATTRDAIEGEKKLLAGGLAVAVMPLPGRIGAGCGICLRVAPADLERARSILGHEGPGTGFQHIYAIANKTFTLWNP
ncbi:MAG: DUF3343 domain-containing protein [Treponema sp.]|jgi:hypothetical protein|nr:DUF3343 domain-containing protein [Treponema sp.]